MGNVSYTEFLALTFPSSNFKRTSSANQGWHSNKGLIIKAKMSDYFRILLMQYSFAVAIFVSVSYLEALVHLFFYLELEF